ncbi:MAG: hypothetical protein J6Z79_07560 [Clostridia bacterium]|nr:hypothetical protein [Clostridia bacterium]
MKSKLCRILAVCLSLTILFSGGTLPALAEGETKTSSMVGDVDGDGFVRTRDAAIVARHPAGWEDYIDENGGVACPEPPEECFSVGYGIVDTTPDLGFYKRMPLAGYGNTDTRHATGVPENDGLKVTCVAVRDAAGETILMLSVDIVGFAKDLGLMIRENASRQTLVPLDHISVTASHTHTGPDNADTSVSRGYTQRYFLDLVRKAGQAARRAVNDLAPATLWAGDTSVNNINFVRRFLVSYSSSSTYDKYETHNLIGDNNRVGYEGPNNVDDGVTYLAHETPGDNEVQYLLFKRDGLRDVLMYNWQCHPDQVGNGCYDLNTDGSYVGKYNTSSKTNRIVSADFINGSRNVLEGEGYLTAYYQGGAGNMNQNDRIDNAQNKQIGSTSFTSLRLSGWDSKYYNYCYSGTNTNKGYWKSQMVGAIVGDAIIKDIATTPKNYAAPVHNDTSDSHGVARQNWTDDWQGIKQLPTGAVRAVKSTYYSTYQSNDRDLRVVMNQLAGIANGSITFKSSYAVQYQNKGTTVTVGATELNAIRSLAAEYAGKSTDVEKKAFAWSVLNTYRKKINEAFTEGMEENGGSGGSLNVQFCVARLLCRLATGLYVNNYYANALNNRSAWTDLTAMDTKAEKFTAPIELYVFSIGQSVAFCFCPYEPFDTVGQQLKDGRYIRYDEAGMPVTVSTNVSGTTFGAATYTYTDEKSPFALTFLCGYSNSSWGYMPTRYARNHTESQNFQNGYETYVTRFAVGTAEEHGEELLTMLHILYNNGSTEPRISGHTGSGV